MNILDFLKSRNKIKHLQFCIGGRKLDSTCIIAIYAHINRKLVLALIFPKKKENSAFKLVIKSVFVITNNIILVSIQYMQYLHVDDTIIIACTLGKWPSLCHNRWKIQSNPFGGSFDVLRTVLKYTSQFNINKCCFN